MSNDYHSSKQDREDAAWDKQYLNQTPSERLEWYLENIAKDPYDRKVSDLADKFEYDFKLNEYDAYIAAEKYIYSKPKKEISNKDVIQGFIILIVIVGVFVCMIASIISIFF